MLALTGGLGWNVAVTGLAQNPPKLEDYRRYALTHEGDVAHGKQLFSDEQKLACIKCHSTDGSASKAGPDLFAVGDAFGRRDIVDSILTPSAVISPGYGTVIATMKDGTEYQGTLKRATDTQLQLMGADGKLVTLAKTDIAEQKGGTTSLMPDGLQTGLSLQDFNDLIDYLVTLKQPESALTSNHGMPSVIPALAKPIGALPFFGHDLKVPPARVQTGLTDFHQVPGHPNLFLVLHQKGMIWMMEKTAASEEQTVFADLTKEVFSDRGPNGLLGMTFHPKFSQNRKYYLKYQIFEDGKVTTILVEKTFAADFHSDSGQQPRRLIAIKSVAEDHSGGCVQFGPDGYLYFAMGDTGPHNDPNGHAQNMQLLLGKMMRLDVDHTEGDKAYAIPTDNPFRGSTDVAPEIWASGFRNPWRFCFDNLTGDLWLADVGQDRVEEVDLVRRGANYGWNVFEAFENFSNQYKKAGRTFTPPVFAYRRKYGNSITGGYVYRGDPKSSFYGVYLCGDYTSKRIFGVTQENGVLKAVHEIGRIPQGLVSFSADDAGNIYAVGFEGMVYKLDFSGSRFDETKTE
ncbi:MAG TPA: PQQ-dependent sugar dehydrogenase [Candidatus Limnocylindria bacterium]|jgi:putative heme-binding domain-containing protein|nr:PQQ-dependent sugar dehydrogenase [Candidatus Limnocylindria bacterium]